MITSDKLKSIGWVHAFTASDGGTRSYTHPADKFVQLISHADNTIYKRDGNPLLDVITITRFISSGEASYSTSGRSYEEIEVYSGKPETLEELQAIMAKLGVGLTGQQPMKYVIVERDKMLASSMDRPEEDENFERNMKLFKASFVEIKNFDVFTSFIRKKVEEKEGLTGFTNFLIELSYPDMVGKGEQLIPPGLTFEVVEEQRFRQTIRSSKTVARKNSYIERVAILTAA